VAITRARRGLIVVGNPDTLQSDRTWAAWLRWARQNGAWLTTWNAGLSNPIDWPYNL